MVPEVGDTVELHSPYGVLRLLNVDIARDRTIENGRSGSVVGTAAGGALLVAFEGEQESHAVPIHWLGVTEVKGNNRQ